MALTLTGDGSVVVASHRSAALLHGLDGFTDDGLEVTAARGRFRAAEGVRVHVTDTLRADDVVVIDGIRTTGLARTVCDLGAVVSDDAVLRAADDVARRTSRRWLDATLSAVGRPGPTGTGPMRWALASGTAVGTVESWFERLVVEQLRAAGLEVVPQFVLRDDGGRFVARFDAAVPAARVAVEAHSRRWHFGAAANVRDADRDARASALDWVVVYVRFDETRTPGAVVGKVLPVVSARLSGGR
jgi:hypothetical protein